MEAPGKRLRVSEPPGRWAPPNETELLRQRRLVGPACRLTCVGAKSRLAPGLTPHSFRQAAVVRRDRLVHSPLGAHSYRGNQRSLFRCRLRNCLGHLDTGLDRTPLKEGVRSFPTTCFRCQFALHGHMFLHAFHRHCVAHTHLNQAMQALNQGFSRCVSAA